jgi:hypothetical protein
MSAPTVDDIREAIRVKLAAVADIGEVHDYERYSAVASKLSEHYVTNLGGADKRLQGWFVAYRGTERISPGRGRYCLTHRWEMRGFWALEDETASEKAFDAKLEEIGDAFEADENLGGLISSTVLGTDDAPGPAGVQVKEKNAVIFAGILCHAARMELFTRHYR